MPLVQLDGVTKVYGGPAATVTALNGVSLDIARGERLALVGKSGSGKSTLLQILGGLDRPTAGRALVDGDDLGALSPNGLADYRLRRVGMIFQAFHLIASRTALQNVELPLVFAGMQPRERRTVALEALESVGLSARADHLPAELSGGERQRIAVARALVNRPTLLLADEPTGNLDSVTAAAVVELLATRGPTLVLVMHDEELAGRVADRIVRLSDGRVAEGGTA